MEDGTTMAAATVAAPYGNLILAGNVMDAQFLILKSNKLLSKKLPFLEKKMKPHHENNILYLLDGKEIAPEDLNEIPPAEIKSVAVFLTVLKNACAFFLLSKCFSFLSNPSFHFTT